jgi:hypothetical protein
MESNEKLEELLKRMYAQESLHDDDIDTNDIINEEWTKFEAEHFRSKRQPFFFKIAAMFISVLMLGGIAYATIHLFEKQEIRGKKQETIVVANSTPSTLHSTLAEQDNALQQSIVYEDKELSTILNDIATFYQVECVYKNEEVKHVRLYFTWDKQQTIDEVIDMFNKFERFHISRNSQKLIVE